MKTIAVLFLTLLLTAYAHADDFRLHSRHITTDNGLLGNTVNEMVQDSDGYIWMATNNGLSRYDGYATVNYSSLACDDQHHLVARIGRIFHDAVNHLLWISTATYQNACYDLQRARFTDWTGRGDSYRQMNKLMMTRRGMLFYGEGLGARLSRRLPDGRFVVYDYNQQTGSLPDDNILTIVEDSAGTIWLPTKKGIAFLHAVTDASGSTDTLACTTVMNEVHIIAAAAARESYFLSSNGDVYTFQGTKLKRRTTLPLQIGVPKKVNTSFIWQGRWMLFTSEGTLSIDLTTGNCTRPEQWQISDGLNQGTCEGYHFIGTRQGQLWIFPDNGMPLSLDLIPKTQHATNKGWLFHVVKDGQGRLFIATYGAGLYVYDTTTGTLTHYSANDPSPIIASDYLTTAMIDRQGCVWVGTEMAGAYCLTVVSSKTASYVKPNPMVKGDRSNAVSSLSLSADGLLLLGMRNGNIYAMSTVPTAQTSLVLHEKMETDITAQLTDGKGHRWTGTWGSGLFCDALCFSTTETERYIASDFIGDIAEDEKGHIWIATWNGGIMKVSGDTIRQVMTSNLNGSRVSDIDITPDGTVWAATNDGICQITAEEKVSWYNTANGLFVNDEINALCFDPPSTLWVATAGSGVIKCEITREGKLSIERTYDTGMGLACNNATAIVKDKEGNVWIGTENGMSRITPHANIIDTYHFAETPQGNAVNKKCTMTDENGQLYIGTDDGLLVLNPTQFNTAEKRRLAITNIHINGEQYLTERPAALSHEQNNLTFFFSCFEYSDRQEPLFQYYLEGLERSWQNTTQMNQAVYRNLQPGRYAFHVRTTDAGGKWQQDTTYSFTVSQPWYNRWWAWAVYVLLLSLLCLYLYRNWHERFRLHQQMKMERQLTDFRLQLFTDITHEFRTPLAIIKGATDKLAEDGSNKTAQQTMQRATNRMLRMVNQFLEFRKIRTNNLRLQVEQGDIVAFIRDIVQDLWGMAKQKDQQLTFTPFSKRHDMVFDQHLLESITYNLLSNAIKYTPERGNISVTLRPEGDNIVLCVEDDGPGISDQQQEQLFKPFVHGYVSHGGMGIGLYTAYQMAVTHKGTLSYQRTGEAGGSRFMLSLPADNAYDSIDYLDDHTRAFQQKTEESEQEPSIIREMQGEALNDLTVAVIEDDLDIMQQIKSEIGIYFNTVGYTTAEAAYKGIQAQQPSLLICDVMLPDASGYEIVSRLKADSKTANTPIIMLTALNDEASQIRAYKAGADDYMVKPCNFRLLIARVMQLIKWHAAESGNSGEDEKGNEKKNENTEAQPLLIESRIDKAFLEKLERLTCQHMHETTLNVDRLAELMNMGRTKFYGKVKELTLMSPNRYIQEKRMARAAELLLEGELSISEICYKVGMQDPSYFNKVFKSHFGVVPSKYGK